MDNQQSFSSKKWMYFGLFLVAVFSLSLKINTLQVGAPYVTIDDQTMYEGGFLVWFGQAPPQRMYLESWVSGIVSIATYAARSVASGDSVGLNLVADAYRDFYLSPDPYVTSYRSVMLLVDMLTAFLIFLAAREIFRDSPTRDSTAALATSLFLLTYNTLWCYVVARPDTLMTFFAVLGLWLYYRSDFGNRFGSLLLSGISFGLATGMKLHGAFFVVFICVDMWRQLGLKVAFCRLFAFGLLSVISFSVAAGSILFDPLLYIKLRLLNARDDASPWLVWGDQFIAMLRGTGWLVIPVLVATVAYTLRRHSDDANLGRLKSLILLSVLWLLLFSAIRVLRPYWMLPALPLFYMIAAYGIGQLSRIHWRYPVVALLVVVMGCQITFQMRAFTSTPFNELRDWVSININPEDGFYIAGYSAVNVPKNTNSIREHTTLIKASLETAVTNGESFTERHIRLWEERARLRLYDMLNFTNNEGYQYQSYHLIEPNDLPGGNLRSSMRYVLVQEHFSSDDQSRMLEELRAHYQVVAQLVGPGGGGQGLSYDVYKRLE